MPWILDLVTSFLELFLRGSSSSRSYAKAFPRQNDNDNDDENHHKTQMDEDSKAKALQAAFEFFETTPTEATRESIKKKFRKMSLMHHPDRNGNSEDSVLTMQKVNNFYKILNDEFDRREGVQRDGNDDDFEAAEEEVSPQQDRRKAKAAKKAAKKQRCDQQETEARKKFRERRQREQEMEAANAEVRKQRMMLNRERKRNKNRARYTVREHRLDTKEGRARANREWEETVQSMSASAEPPEETTTATNNKSVHDIDDGDDATNAAASIPSPGVNNNNNNTKSNQKPKNLVMECCDNEIAVALRMDFQEVAIDLIQDALKAFLQTQCNRRDGYMNEQEIIMDVIRFFIRPLDDDGNTILHYAAHYESPDVMHMVYHTAAQFQRLPDVFLHENVHGHIPLAYCCPGGERPSVRERLQSLTQLARDQQPMQKTIRRMKGLFTNFDLAATIATGAYIFVGRYIFETGALASTILLAVVLYIAREDTPSMRFGGFVTLQTQWIIVCWIASFVQGWYRYGAALAVVLTTFCCSPLAFGLLEFYFYLTLVMAKTCSRIVFKIPIPKIVQQLSLEELQYLGLFAWCFVPLLLKVLFWEIGPETTG